MRFACTLQYVVQRQLRNAIIRCIREHGTTCEPVLQIAGVLPFLKQAPGEGRHRHGRCIIQNRLQNGVSSDLAELRVSR
jgi:hypothetical protein